MTLWEGLLCTSRLRAAHSWDGPRCPGRVVSPPEAPRPPHCAWGETPHAGGRKHARVPTASETAQPRGEGSGPWCCRP